MAGDSYFSELRKRRVFRAAAIYFAVAWGLTEVIVTISEQLFLPAWVATLSVIMFVVGFPVAMMLSWTFDITAEGIRRTDIGTRRGTVTIAASVILLIFGTAGLFLLIQPGFDLPDKRAGNTSLSPYSVVVLPFENISRREDDFYLSEGLGDELRDQLSQVKDLQIAARSSSIAARNQAVGAIEMAATLGVAYLVEGSLRRNGPRLNISVQLIDGGTGLAVWSQNYQRGRLEIIDVQQDIARQIVTTVFPDGQSVSLAAPATLDATAADLMLLARHDENRVRSRQVRDDETLLRAVRLYREATVADPKSALAHSRLAGALLYLGDIEAAEVSIMTALSLDPDLSEVQNTLGELYWARGDPEAGAAFERAIELNPNNVDALHNYANLKYMTTTSESDELVAEELYRRAGELDRLSLSRHIALGDYLAKNGHWDAVPPIIHDIQELFDNAESRRAVGWLYELLGEVDLAIAWTLRAQLLEPNNPDHVEKLADQFALIGDSETALRLVPSPGVGLLLRLRRYEELIDLAELLMIEEPDDMGVRHILAFAYSVTGNAESTIRILTSTGLPDSVLNGQTRSELEWDGFQTLMDALAASGIPEAVDLGRGLAQWSEDEYWWGDVGTIALYRSCTRAILGSHEEALQVLARMKEGRRLQSLAYLQDWWCFQRFKDERVYQDVVNDQVMRRAALRERLPVTLAEFGLSMP